MRTGCAPALAAFADQQGSKLYCFYKSLGAAGEEPVSYLVAAWA